MVILDHFATYTKLPIKINAIADFIRESGFVNRIVFHAIEEEPDITAVPGIMLRRKDLTPYAVGEIADIVYSLAWPYSLQRLVCAKELIHTTMEEATWTRTKAEVSKLTQGITLPASAQIELAKIDPKLVADHSGLLLALALLIPRDARLALLPAYKANKMGDEEVAAVAEIPEAYVSLVMSEGWGAVLEALCPD